MDKICWNITSKCNKNCSYCFRFYEDCLPYAENKKILNNIQKMGVKKIVWSGGEPFLYKDIIKLLALSKEKGIYNSVITNASLLNENNIAEHLKYIDKLIVSLDFINDTKNTEYGIGENYYKHLSKVLLLSKKIKKDIIIQVNTVVFSGNYKYIKDLMLELNKYNIDNWKAMVFIPIRGKAMINKMDLSITADQFKEVLRVVDNVNTNYNIIINDNKDLLKTHYIVLSSGKLIKSIDGDDIFIKSLL